MQEIGPFLARLRDVFDVQLFVIAGTPITLATVVVFGIVILTTMAIARFLERAVNRVFTARGPLSEGTAAAVSRLVYYTVLVVGFGIAVHSVGINLTALFAAGAVFAVAIGFAMQNLAQNFVSGIILLLERTITPGDILEFQGQLVQVREMGIRATVARTLDDEEVIIPNSLLVSEAVTNYTLRDTLFRVRSLVGVVYSSDMRRVREVLEATAHEIPWRSERSEPRVLLTEFADSSVNFEVSVWIESPWEQQSRRSLLNEAIWWALAEAGITIAFPQLDLHLDPPVTESLRRLSASA